MRHGDIWLGEGNTEVAYELLGVMDHQGQKWGIPNNSIEFYRLALLDEDFVARSGCCRR